MGFLKDSEGVVVKIRGNGKAEVRLPEPNPGIIGAPHVNVCHNTSPGSVVVTQAINRAAFGGEFSLFINQAD